MQSLRVRSRVARCIVRGVVSPGVSTSSVVGVPVAFESGVVVGVRDAMVGATMGTISSSVSTQATPAPSTLHVQPPVLPLSMAPVGACGGGRETFGSMSSLSLLAGACLAVAASVVSGDTVVASEGRCDSCSVSKAVDRALKSVVRIKIRPLAKDGMPASRLGSIRETIVVGSGFVVTRDGFVATNCHVLDQITKLSIREKTRIEVEFSDGRALVGRAFAKDKGADVGLIRLSSPDGGKLDLEPAALGDVSSLKVGDRLVVLGAPLGGAITAAVGALGGRHYWIDEESRHARGADFQLHKDWDLLQVDANMLQGCSGGPVVNNEGEVVGINCMGKAGMGLGSLSYAVSISQAWPVMQSLLRSRAVVRPTVGVVLSRANRLNTTLPPGVEVGLHVGWIKPDGPAHIGGLKTGDVIVEVNNKPMSTKGDFIAALGPVYDPSHVLNCTVLRNGKYAQVSVRPGKDTPAK